MRAQLQLGAVRQKHGFAPGGLAHGHAAERPDALIHGDTFSISALHLAIKAPYF
eukprot:SAG31_NODE_12418_length_943_cov_1.648104_1_plen_53_part_10